MATLVDSGGVPLDKYKRAASRVPLPLKFDDAAQVGETSSLVFRCVRGLLVCNSLARLVMQVNCV